MGQIQSSFASEDLAYLEIVSFGFLTEGIHLLPGRFKLQKRMIYGLSKRCGPDTGCFVGRGGFWQVLLRLVKHSKPVVLCVLGCHSAYSCCLYFVKGRPCQRVREYLEHVMASSKHTR